MTGVHGTKEPPEGPGPASIKPLTRRKSSFNALPGSTISAEKPSDAEKIEHLTQKSMTGGTPLSGKTPAHVTQEKTTTPAMGAARQKGGLAKAPPPPSDRVKEYTPKEGGIDQEVGRFMQIGYEIFRDSKSVNTKEKANACLNYIFNSDDRLFILPRITTFTNKIQKLRTALYDFKTDPNEAKRQLKELGLNKEKISDLTKELGIKLDGSHNALLFFSDKLTPERQIPLLNYLLDYIEQLTKTAKD